MAEAVAFLFISMNSSHAHALHISYKDVVNQDATVLELMKNVVFRNGNRLLRRKVISHMSLG